jgi:hypothetical protein
MSQTASGNPTHSGNVALAEMQRQVAVTAAGNSQAAVTAAEVIFYRTCLTSAIANKCGTSGALMALKALGVGA